MIQRIQSIFLFLAAGASLGLFLLPFASTNEAQANSTLFADATFNVQDNTIMMGIFALCGLLLFVNIFLFNNRKLQMKVTLFSILLVIAGACFAVYSVTQDAAMRLAEPDTGIALPVLALVFGFLAYRYINKDEKLVKSVDRLR